MAQNYSNAPSASNDFSGEVYSIREYCGVGLTMKLDISEPINGDSTGQFNFAKGGRFSHTTAVENTFSHQFGTGRKSERCTVVEAK